MQERQKSTKEFNVRETATVFLISTQAGGLGLNLYGANRVIIFDIKWSPMWEQQAVGRAYRLGQKKHVYVYRFRVSGTFEDSIWNNAKFKEQLQSRVVDQKFPARDATKQKEQCLAVLSSPPENVSDLESLWFKITSSTKDKGAMPMPLSFCSTTHAISDSVSSRHS